MVNCTSLANSLERFVKAQDEYYSGALQEIRSGRKNGHWMWFIFPQLRALGFSSTAQYYGIADLTEAKAYLAHPVLRKHLIEISEALLVLNESNPFRVMGTPDDLKLCSSMTLFEIAEPRLSVFSQVLEKFYAGNRDVNTLKYLAKDLSTEC